MLLAQVRWLLWPSLQLVPLQEHMLVQVCDEGNVLARQLGFEAPSPALSMRWVYV